MVLAVPDTVKNISIWIDSKHDVFHSCVMNERTLGMNEEHVWHPDLFHQPSVKRSTFVAAGGERQSIILPVMSEVQGHREVLYTHKRHFNKMWKVGMSLFLTCSHDIYTIGIHPTFGHWTSVFWPLAFASVVNSICLNGWGFTVSLMYADRAKVKSD